MSAKVLFEADRTCCVCRDPSKAVQIHHLDENPANHVERNLSVLCLDCHNKTQLRGGFGRHLNSAQVELYRNDWKIITGKKRSNSSEIIQQAIISKLANGDEGMEEELKTMFVEIEKRKLEAGLKLLSSDSEEGNLARHLMNLIELRRKLYAQAQPEWDSGITSRMVNASYAVTEGLIEMMVGLTKYFKSGPLAGEAGRQYLHDRVSSFYDWKRACEETVKNEGRGTLSNVRITASVLSEAEGMLVSMAASLAEDLFDFNFLDWRRNWEFNG